jgi:uncharacterized protein (TIGR02246 family)
MQEAAIRGLLAEVQAAWNAHDMARFAANFADDADFVNVRGLWWRGRDEIEERHAASHASRFRESRMANRLEEAREIAPEVWVAHVRWTMEGHLRSGPRETAEVRNGISTWVLQRRGTKLLIVAAHNTDELGPPREERSPAEGS